MPRKGSKENNILLQGVVDIRKLAGIVLYYKGNDETEKIYNMSSLLRAIVNDWAQLCGEDDIEDIGWATAILQSEKLMPLREATQKRVLNAEIDQAAVEITAEAHEANKPRPIDPQQNVFNALARQAFDKYKEERKIERLKETFGERMARLRSEAEVNKQDLLDKGEID